MPASLDQNGQKHMDDSSIVSDLDREIKFASRTSAFYGAVFRILKELFVAESRPQDGALRNTIETIEKEWGEKTWTAWFERPLLLAAALHRLARGGAFPRLARFYATCGGAYEKTQFDELRAAVFEVLAEGSNAFLNVLRTQMLQTNEISRGVCWQLPVASIMAGKASPVVLVELGCSAGLNLISDHYGWQIDVDGKHLLQTGGAPGLRINVCNEANVPVQSLLPGLEKMKERIGLRIGCDLNVPNTRHADDRAMLESLIWGDNPDRLARLAQAIDTQSGCLERGELELRKENAISFVGKVAQEIKSRVAPGATICFFNTVVTCYFDSASYKKLKHEIHVAFGGTLAEYECFWIEHEPRRAEEHLTTEQSHFESLVRIHRMSATGELVTSIVAGTEMHPRNMTLLEPMFNMNKSPQMLDA